MHLVTLTSVKSAERNGYGRAYLARLAPGLRGSIDREFIRPKKISDGTRGFMANARPGDIFEARRWLWDGLRQQYVGGTIWFGLQPDGSAIMLTRDEAFAAVHAVRVDTTFKADTTPDTTRAMRVIPGDLVIQEMTHDVTRA